MSAEMHNRVRALFDEALQWPEAERLPRLQSACGGELEILDAVMRLLNAYRKSDSFLQDRAPSTQRIGRYVVTGELGRGGMGVVYDAVDPVIGRKIAVKVIRFQSFTDAKEAQFLRERLFREARAAGPLSHPGIVGVFDVGQEGDLAFIAMERAEGLSLDRVLASGRRFSRDELIHMLSQVAAALDYAHCNGVVHRDVKPANIILDNRMTARITDFGIAKLVSAQTQTMTGMMVGTPLYMSPEQVDTLSPDGRSDQYSLAVVAYEILTGRRPFYADTLASLAHMIVYANRPSARAANAELPPAVDVVLRRGLARFPKERFASCSEFVAALTAAFREPQTQPHGPRPFEQSPLRDANESGGGTLKDRIVVAAVAAVLLTGLLFLVLWSPNPDPGERPFAVPHSTAPAKSKTGPRPTKDKSAKLAQPAPPVTATKAPPDSGAAPTPLNPLPVTSRVTLTPLNPVKVDETAASPAFSTPAVIQFVNHSKSPVDIYWIDREGDRVLDGHTGFKEVPVGEKRFENTALAQPFLVVASGTGGTTAQGTGTLLAAFQAVTPNPTYDRRMSDIAIITETNAAARNEAPVGQKPDAAPNGASGAPGPGRVPAQPSQPTKVNAKDGLTYVWIRPGTFQMGCKEEANIKCVANEKPAHQVTISKGFWMGQTEVTQEAWQRVMRTNPSQFKGARLPVENVTWNDAQEFCQTVDMRLPTESEWEYAARAGSTGSRYGDPPAISWFRDNSQGTTHDVGQKQANPWGLYDMLGNVSEWVADRYAPYGPGSTIGPRGPSSGPFRVLRGGAWDDHPAAAQISYRNGYVPANHYNYLGFRCAGN